MCIFPASYTTGLVSIRRKIKEKPIIVSVNNMMLSEANLIHLMRRLLQYRLMMVNDIKA
jgi:hypothetical protein